MGAKIFLSYRRDDAGGAARLRARLDDRFGRGAVFEVESGTTARSDIENSVAQAAKHCESMLVLIGPTWLSATDGDGRRRIDDPHDLVRLEIVAALAAGKRIIPVLVDGAEMPRAMDLPTDLKPLAFRQAIELGGNHLDAAIDRLIDEFESLPASMTTGAPPSATSPPHEPVLHPEPSPARAPRRSRGGAAGAAVGALTGVVVGAAASVLTGLRGVFSTANRANPKVPPSPSEQQPVDTLGKGGSDPVEPVYLGVTAPPACRPGDRFNAVLAAYIESARASTQAKLQRLGGQGTAPLLDLAPDRQLGWRIGAPITVRVTATQADIEPAERSFDWDGRENLVAFTVRVRQDAQAAELDLCFHVALAGVPIACIPLPVALSSQAPEHADARIKSIRTAETAFASYSSKDAQTVGYCLSTLTRWSPGLAIFQDCLDLRPGEAFKPQLSTQITGSDVFLLFWSRNASASPWVHWEYDTARKAKGLDAVIPMPLEDPKIAPPPPEFADEHMRDRFMVARYALAKIDEVTRSSGRG